MGGVGAGGKNPRLPDLGANAHGVITQCKVEMFALSCFTPKVIVVDDTSSPEEWLIATVHCVELHLPLIIFFPEYK